MSANAKPPQQPTNQQAKRPNAAQRLETVELNIREIEMYLNNMARDLSVAKQAIKLLGNKLDAVVKAAGLSNEQISEIMIDNNVEDLRQKVDEFILQGVLVPGTVITEKSFVVGHEIDKDDKVANKRLQFSVGALQPELREKLIGSTAGSTVTFREDALRYVVDEVYDIQSPEEKTDQAAEAAAAAPAESADAAPAEAAPTEPTQA